MLSFRNLVSTKRWLLPLVIILFFTGACSLFPPTTPQPPTPTPTETAIPIDVIVEQTLAARGAVETQVAQTVAAISGDDSGSDPVGSTPTATLEVIKVEPDPNVASGTPQLRVSANSINVRSGPSTDFPPTTTLSKDSVVTLIAKNSDGTWCLIEYKDGSGSLKRGWVAHSVTTPVDGTDLAKVEVAVTIPAPPSTATATNLPATSTPTTTATAAVTTAATTAATSAPTHTPTPEITLISPTAVPSTIEINNQGGYPICEVYIASSDSPDWGSNLLQNEMLSNGNSKVFTYPDAGPYDVRVVECLDAGNYFYSYNIEESWFNMFNSSVLQVSAPPTPSQVLIDNTFNYDICEVYIAATGATDWGSNLLSTRLGDLEQVFLSYAGVGPYDVQVKECSDSGTNYAEWFEIYGHSGFAGP